MARQLFGTDGIRGVAGVFPLDSKTVFSFGVALGEWAAKVAGAKGVAPAVVLGMDTRESGPPLANCVAGGLAAAGITPRFAGLTTTPGVAYLTRSEDFVAGVMISASHNPYQDNGLKVFDHSGFKLPDDAEHRLEEQIFKNLAKDVTVVPLELRADETLDLRYVDFLASTFHGTLQGMRLVLDCANGAASRLGPYLFEKLGATVIRTGCSPNGRNINHHRGALHTDHLRKKVLEHQADAGAAFDGDADRCMIVSGSGKLIDGDHVLLIAAKALLAQSKLHGNNGQPAVVATVMSNLGLERALASHGVKLVRTAVGDKYVLEEMIRSSLPVGGEQSGHVIFRDFATTGDGLLTALRVFEMIQNAGRSLDELTEEFFVYPQKLVNVRFKNKKPLDELPGVQAEIQATQNAFGDAGRVLVRFSGTEPLARVMVEGPELSQVELYAQRIAGAIAAELGS
jgi:phosphoglucosamine mutase